ncbi:MAG: glycogen/starch/alpha-glucan phosphorylase, partial [Planctomycetota bacterium]
MNTELKIAYFSMEIGLSNDIPTYSGGLGVLAGDTIKSGADLKIPLVAVTLLSKKGFFKQDIDNEGKQIEYPVEWDPFRFMTRQTKRVVVKIEGRDVSIQAWCY